MGGRTRAFISGWAIIFLVSCASGPEKILSPRMDPAVFFADRALGKGVLTYRDGTVDRQFEVVSEGGNAADGTFTIDQTITFDDGEVQRRQWRLKAIGPDGYEGTLTDAIGPVTATIKGSVLTLSYPLADVPMGQMTQHLYLQPDAVTVVNEGTVRIAGVTVRRLHEVITRHQSDAAPQALSATE